MAEVKAGLPQSALKPITDSGVAEADEKYRNALDYITQALLAREGNNQQQQLLAISQGLLTPGPTGHFGESVGHAAGNVLKVKKEQEAAGLENAKMRLQLAQAEREMAQRTQAAGAFRGLVGGQRPGAATTGAPGAPATAGAPGATPAAPGEGGASGQQVQNITLQDALAFAAAFPEQKELAKTLMDAAKFNSERYKIAMNGTVFDTMTGQYIAQIPPGQTASSYFLPEIGGNQLMTPGQYSSYQAAREKGLGRQWVQDFMSTEGPKAATKEPPKILTQADVEAAGAGAKERATKTAAAEVDRTQQTIEAGRGANTRITHYKTMEGFAKKPGVAELLGYFERPDFLAAAGKFIEEGRFGVPQMREILSNLGAPQDVINNLNVLSSLAAQTSIDFSKSYGKGQGAVSDFERRLYASLGPTIKDPLEAFMMKSKLLTAKAEYERDLASALRRSKKSFDDFQDTPEYQKIIDSYQNKAYEVAGIKQPSAAPSGPITADDVKRRLGAK